MGDKLCIFNDDIDPDDVNQGNLGNCYFLATLSAIAEREKRIIERFLTYKVNSAGIYLVTIFVNGTLTPIIIDDWFPVRYGRPVFCRPNDGQNEIWAMLLEKAWAK